jgi:hypothetical protein
MLLKVMAVAGIVGFGVAQTAMAQDLHGPREVPGPGYTGQQYVDSAGCVFLRAGINGRVTWVPRVDRQRKQLCGYPASGTTRVAAAPAAPAAEPAALKPAPVAAPAPVAVASRPVPQSQGGPIDTVASLTTPPRIGEAAASPVATPAPAPAAVTGTPGCPANAPFGERHVLPDGRLALLCGRDPGRLAAFVARVTQAPRRAPEPEVTQVATAPVALPQPGVGTLPRGASGVATGGRLICPASSPVAREFPLRGGGSTVLCTSGAGGVETAVAAVSGNGQAYAPVIPRGYTLAWTDDRLNPLRGVGTAEGQMAQDQIWTREVPARLIADTAKGKKRVVVVAASNSPVQKRAVAVKKAQVSTSTSTAPRAAVATGKARLFVQVGSFGVPSNAEGARARLSGMGLPVAGSKAQIKGKPVQVVYAGPFASAADAQAALAAARRAGFGDAFIR